MELIGDPWLLELATRGPLYQGVCARLLRCQILTARYTNHVLDFGDEEVRRAIGRYARYGKVSRCPVRCLRCGTSAGLRNWEYGVDLRGDFRQDAINRMRQSYFPGDAAYLEQCDPKDTATGMLAVLGLKDGGE